MNILFTVLLFGRLFTGWATGLSNLVKEGISLFISASQLPASYPRCTGGISPGREAASL
jgi:hypothetical protein